jgi:hypothetical protein
MIRIAKRWLVGSVFIAILGSASADAGYVVSSNTSFAIDRNQVTHLLFAGAPDKLGNQFYESAVARARVYRELYPDHQVILWQARERPDGKESALAAAMGINVLEDTTADMTAVKLITWMRQFKKIASIEIFSHSSWATGAALQSPEGPYRITGNTQGIDTLKGNFLDGAYAVMYGCNTGFTLAPALSNLWGIPVLGSFNATDFQNLHKDGNFYHQGEGNFPTGASFGKWPFASTNKVSFPETVSCEAAGCIRMNPDNMPYKGVWGNYRADDVANVKGGGLGFYKTFCNYDWGPAGIFGDKMSRGEKRCLRGMGNFMMSYLTTIHTGDVSYSGYKTRVLDFMCPRVWWNKKRQECEQQLGLSESFTNMSYSSYSGNVLDCDFKGCKYRFLYDRDSKGVIIRDSIRLEAPENTTPRTQVREYLSYLKAWNIVAGTFQPRTLPPPPPSSQPPEDPVPPTDDPPVAPQPPQPAPPVVPPPLTPAPPLTPPPAPAPIPAPMPPTMPPSVPQLPPIAPLPPPPAPPAGDFTPPLPPWFRSIQGDFSRIDSDFPAMLIPAVDPALRKLEQQGVLKHDKRPRTAYREVQPSRGLAQSFPWFGPWNQKEEEPAPDDSEIAQRIDAYFHDPARGLTGDQLWRPRKLDGAVVDACRAGGTWGYANFFSSITQAVEVAVPARRIHSNPVIDQGYGLPGYAKSRPVGLASHPLCRMDAGSMAYILGDNSVPDSDTIATINGFADKVNDLRVRAKTDKNAARKLSRTWSTLFGCLAYAESLASPGDVDPDKTKYDGLFRSFVDSREDIRRAFDQAGITERPSGVLFWTDRDGGFYRELYKARDEGTLTPEFRALLETKYPTWTVAGLYQFSPEAYGNASTCMEQWNEERPGCRINFNDPAASLAIASPGQTFNAYCGVMKVVESFNSQINTVNVTGVHPENLLSNGRIKPSERRCVSLVARAGRGRIYAHFGPLRNSTGKNLAALMSCVKETMHEKLR